MQTLNHHSLWFKGFCLALPVLISWWSVYLSMVVSFIMRQRKQSACFWMYLAALWAGRAVCCCWADEGIWVQQMLHSLRLGSRSFSTPSQTRVVEISCPVLLRVIICLAPFLKCFPVLESAICAPKKKKKGKRKDEQWDSCVSFVAQLCVGKLNGDCWLEVKWCPLQTVWEAFLDILTLLPTLYLR